MVPKTAKALERAGEQQHVAARGQATNGGGNGKADHAHDEGTLPAPEVGDAATEKQE
jgi:hypothetical protein